MNREELLKWLQGAPPNPGEIRYKLLGENSPCPCVWDGEQWIEVTEKLVSLFVKYAPDPPSKNNYYRLFIAGHIDSEENWKKESDKHYWNFKDAIRDGYLIPVEWNSKKQIWGDKE